ncbi:hypothetical protein ACVR05_01330 [Streptococcus caprae]|uniref:V-type ATP synthase subunit E n=1 Tax=Streptococcus caprae TaxID=1640501 RepID=A0ABV8CUI8_9STRE
MSEMEQLKASVLEQAHEQGRQLLAEATQTTEKEFERKQQALLQEREALRNSQIGAVKRQLQREEQQIQNQARQSTLVTKNKVLKEIFKSAQETMENWEGQKQADFISKLLARYQGQAIRVQFGQLTLDKLSQEDLAGLKASVPQAKFVAEGLSQEAGIVVTAGQVDDNYLFSRLVDSLWNQESYRMATAIFTEE